VKLGEIKDKLLSEDFGLLTLSPPIRKEMFVVN